MVQGGRVISVVMPVWREGETVRGTIAALDRAAAGVPYEVIVVDGDPAGSTVQGLQDWQDLRDWQGLREPGEVGAAGACPRLVLHRSPPGRAVQMNAGAQLAQGEILLFLHADTRLGDRAFPDLVAALERDRARVGGAFSLRIDSPRWSLQGIARLTTWRSHLTRIPYGDQAIFLRRDAFANLGGFPEVPLMEDAQLMHRIRQRGDRLVILPNVATTSARRWERDGILYTTLRNRAIVVLAGLGVSLERLAAWYRRSPRLPTQTHHGWLAGLRHRDRDQSDS